MNKIQSVYCYTNIDINQLELNNRYKIVGIGCNVHDFLSYGKGSIDYLIIFVSENGLTKLEKQMLMYLRHVFNSIIVVAKTRINTLNNYLFIEQSLVGYNLNKILHIAKRNTCSQINYSYKNYNKICGNALCGIGFSPKHKGYKYLIDCSYLLADNTIKCKAYSNLYSQVATKYNVTVESVERCIRTAMAFANKQLSFKEKTFNKLNNCLKELSNKKFIIALNEFVIKNLM